MQRKRLDSARLRFCIGTAISVALAVFASTVQAGTPSSDGPPLHTATAQQVLAEVHRPGANAVLVNVWATWCLPCREEFPDLVRLHREFAKRGLRMVFVSADFDDDRFIQVRKFLVAHGVDFPSFLKEGKDEEFIDGLDARWSGALPVTFLYDGSGRPRRFWEGSESYATLKERVLEVLDHPASTNQKMEEGKPEKEAR